MSEGYLITKSAGVNRYCHILTGAQGMKYQYAQERVDEINQALEFQEQYEAALAAKDAEIERLANQLKRCLDGLAPDDEAAVPTEVHGLHAEVAGLRTEYKALWDAVIAFCNAPEGNSNAQYAALVEQAIASRFWNEESNEQDTDSGAQSG